MSSIEGMFTCVTKKGKGKGYGDYVVTFTRLEAIMTAVEASERIARVRRTGVPDGRRDFNHGSLFIDAIGMAGERAMMKMLPPGAVSVRVGEGEMPSRRRLTDKGDIVCGDLCFEVKTTIRTGKCMHLIIPSGFFAEEEIATHTVLYARAATTFCLVIVDRTEDDPHPVRAICNSTFTAAGYISLDEAVKYPARSDGSIWIQESRLEKF